MKRRRIKLVWGAAEVIKGRWYGGVLGLYDRREGKREHGFAISVRGVMSWGLVMLVAAYVAGTAALCAFWQRNPYCLLTYGDAFWYPVSRASVAAKKGQALIAEGQDLLKANKWADGARLLRQGLTLYPGDMKGRQALAKFYLMANQRTQAVSVLSEGLAKEFPGRSYLQSLFSVAAEGEDFDLIVATIDRFLPRVKGARADVDRRWLAAQKFTALMRADRLAEALVFAESEEPGEQASDHRVLALLELGRTAEAAEYLEAWGTRPGADLQAVRRFRVRDSRAAGRLDEMERALAELRVAAPDDPGQAVYGIVQRALAGREDAAKVALEDYLFRFGGSAANLKMAATPLAEMGNRLLFDRCLVAVRERGFPQRAFQVLNVPLHVQRGEWAEAATVLGLMKPSPGQTVPAAEQVWLEWMGRLVAAAAAPGEAVQSSLLEFLRSRPWPMAVFRPAVEALRLAGRMETAREVIALAEVSCPASRWLQTQKAGVAQDLAARRSSELTPVPPTGMPPKDERLFFAELEKLLRERKWAQAENAIREVRAESPPPDWLEKRESDLRLADVSIRQGQGEMPAMLASARLYLNGDVQRAQRMSELAREFFDAGDQPGAIALAQAVLQRTPDYPPAQRQLAAWKPRPATAQ